MLGMFGNLAQRAAIGMALLITSAAPAWSQSREIVGAPADYRHRQTSTALPIRAGEFNRTKVVEYNADGSDASASYDLIRGNEKLVSATVYIYPMPATTPAARSAACVDEYDGIKAAIRDAYTDVKLVKEDTPGTPSPRNSAEGRHARYTFTGNFAGTSMTVRSEAYLYCPPAGKWFVQYRATWPAGRDYERELYALMTAIPWSETLAR